jgi:hypothetical protein
MSMQHWPAAACVHRRAADGAYGPTLAVDDGGTAVDPVWRAISSAAVQPAETCVEAWISSVAGLVRIAQVWPLALRSRVRARLQATKGGQS